MMNLVEIGKRIKALRDETKLTQSKVAEYLSLDQSMIAKIETVDYILYGEKPEQIWRVSFRSNNLTAEDLKSLAVINKIVLNQFKMDSMLEVL